MSTTPLSQAPTTTPKTSTPTPNPIIQQQPPTPLPPPFHMIPSLHPLNDTRRQLHDDVEEYIRSLELSPDWIEVENRPWSNDNNRWTHSSCHGYDFVQYDPRVRMRFFWNENTLTLAGSAFWDNRTEGPAGGAYGGSIMLVFDEILAYPVWRSGTPAFTANVNLNLRKMLPFNTSARFESKVVKIDGRKRFVEAKILTGDGQTLYADAKGLWIASNGIGSSAVVHPETLEQDTIRKEWNNYIQTKHGDFTNNTLQYPMCASSNVQAGQPNHNLQSFGELYQPDMNSVLPYQKHYFQTSLHEQFFPQQVSKPPQAIEPQLIQNQYQTYLYAKL